MKCFYANARSIVKPGKIDELRCIITSLQTIIHIIVLSETWIKGEDEARRLDIPCYTHYYNYRKNKRGGGVSIYVHNNLKHNLVEEHCIDDIHYLWIHIKQLSLNVGAIYKPDKTSIKKFLDVYTQQLHKMKRAIVFGDYNCDLLNPDLGTRLYKYALKENDFKILNKINKVHCTRVTATSGTLLDHVSTNLKENKFHFVLAESPMSDHKQLLLEIKRYNPPSLKKNEYSAYNYTEFYKLLENYPYVKKEETYETLLDKLHTCLKNSKVTKTKVQNLPRQEWIKKEIIEDINNRNTLWRKHKLNTSDSVLKAEFEKAKAAVTKKIQKAKNTYYYKCFKDNMTNPRKMWRLVNDLSKNKIRNSSGPEKLETEEGIITDQGAICEYLNDYFSSIGSSLATLITEKSADKKLSDKPEMHVLTELEYMIPATTDEVIKIIDNLDANTGSGIDGITTKSIKCVKKIIASELTQCINLCLKQGIFPDSLKIAKIIPIYKSGSRSDPSNYRPISVLPVMSKIIEKILYNRLESFLKSNNFFYQKQYGFRPQSNTLSATIDLITKIKNKIDRKQLTLGIFIDLKKAFDTVSPKLLIQKLSDIGVKGKALDIFKSYMQNRKQLVKIGENKSNTNIVSFGVPQGSILGPLLFVIYINNISQIGLNGDLSLYADDTSLFYFGHSIDSIIPVVQADLNLVNDWFKSNLLTINTSKTCYVIFSAKNKTIPNNIELKINNEQIQRKNKEKYLGLILDNYLNWKPHIEKIRNKLLSLTGALHSLSKCLPRNVRYIIYNSLVKPHIDYLIEIWGTAAKSNLEIIQVAQNKLIKTLFNYKFRTPTQKIYEDTKIMNIAKTYKYYTCLLIHKILNKNINTTLTFTKKHQVQKKKLRNSNFLVTRTPRTNYGKKNIEYEGINMYNNLPLTIKEAKNITMFKKLLKVYIVDTL